METDLHTEQFSELSIRSQIHANLKLIGYETPTPIQSQFLPVALMGTDCIGQAQTGTGKTAAFLIPILDKIKRKQRHVQALILGPTRELAVQCMDEARRLSHKMGIESVTLCGGHPIRKQRTALKRGCHLAIGTPGRILHHLKEKTLDVSAITCLVLDEADRMLDIGFRPDIEKIVRKTPKNRQTMLLSATMPPPVLRLSRRYMESPVTIDLSEKAITVDSIDQAYFTVDEGRKFDLLLQVIERDEPTRCIIFCRRKRDAEFLCQDLARRHKSVARMHGDLRQNERNRIMRNFRGGEIRFLVSTDLVGRGIDVDDVSHVINFDIPEDPENYVHRIGRTARMGRDGVAYTFVTPEQGKELTAIEIYINSMITNDRVDGFEAFKKKQRSAV